MRRGVAWALGLVLLLLLVALPALRWGHGSGASTSESAAITDYRAVFVVAKDGGLEATEDLTVSFPVPRHGIFRFFDLADPQDMRARLRPRDVTVLRDGQPEPFEVLDEGAGRYRNVKIGSASTTISGQHVYTIRYRIDGALSQGTDGARTQLYWNLVPGGWAMPIQRTDLTVSLPAEASAVRCAVGTGQGGGCEAQGEGTRRLVVQTGALLPRTPVTIRTGLDLPTPDRVTSPWPLRLVPVLGPSPVALLLLLLLAGFTGLVGLRLARSTREPDPAYPLMYAPPEGIGPAQAHYLFTERTGNEAFVASIMQSAEQGATRLDRGDGWTISDAGDPQAWQRLDPVTAYAAQVLQVPGGSFTADQSVSAGKTLKSALSSFDTATRDWARQNGLVTKAGIGSLGGILVIAAAVVAVLLAFTNPLHVSVVALVPGLFAIFGLELLATGSSTKRTAAGRELWSRIGGFRRILSTTSAEERFDFSGRKELYTAYVPWAVAFGVAREWEAKYRLETGEEPPSPSYLGGGYGYGGSIATTMADDFSSTVSSAISAYEATQSSSSSGGGGFSGGGGGGGGGGGSW